MNSLQMLRHEYPATLLLETSSYARVLKHTCTTGSVYEQTGTECRLIKPPPISTNNLAPSPEILLVPLGAEFSPESPLGRPWSLVIFIAPTGTRGVLPSAHFELLVIDTDAAHVFWRVPGTEPMCTETMLSNAVHLSARSYPAIAQRIVHHLARNPWARFHGRGITTVFPLLQETFPADVTIATLIVYHYGNNARHNLAGAVALETINTFGTAADRVFYEAHNHARRLYAPGALAIARLDPARYTALLMERCCSKHAFAKSVGMANELLANSPATLHTLRLHKQARDFALQSGNFASASLHAVAVFEKTCALYPGQLVKAENELERAVEIALYCSNTVSEAMNAVRAATHALPSSFLAQLPEYQFLTQSDEAAPEAALEAASTLHPADQSLARVMFLARCERRLLDPAQWCDELAARTAKLPSHEHMWLDSKAYLSDTLFLAPRHSSILSQAVALQRAAYLLQTNQTAAFYRHLNVAALHLHGWSPLGAMLIGGFGNDDRSAFDAWFSPSAVLTLDLFGAGEMFFGGRKVHVLQSDLELLAFLSRNPDGASETTVISELYDGEVTPSVVRMRLLRLENLLCYANSRYHIRFSFISDYHRFREARKFGWIGQMQQMHTAPLLQTSNVAFIQSERQDAEQSVAEAVQQSQDATMVWPGPDEFSFVG